MKERAQGSICSFLPLTLGLAFITFASASEGQEPSENDLILFAPLASTFTYLMTLDGRWVHEWRAGSSPGNSVYLLPNGDLLRPTTVATTTFAEGGGLGGRVERYDWNNRLVWSFEYASADHQQHHDAAFLPNGNVLLLAWETRSAAEAIAAGRRSELIPREGVLWVDHLVEVNPTTNEIVWVWRLWDHLLARGQEPDEHPELVDPNFDPNFDSRSVASDWTHANAVAYNAGLDQVILSIRNLSELWILDHGTTTEEAAGHVGGRRGRGGDLLYRWGNPAAYGMEGERQLWGQHNARWIEDGFVGAGNILVFDNGDRNARPYSAVVEIGPPLGPDGSYPINRGFAFGPEEPAWRYVATPPESLFAPFISGAQRLPNGNTLICDGPAGRFLEVTREGETVWSYTVTNGGAADETGIAVFRAERYERGHSGLAGRASSPETPCACFSTCWTWRSRSTRRSQGTERTLHRPGCRSNEWRHVGRAALRRLLHPLRKLFNLLIR